MSEKTLDNLLSLIGAGGSQKGLMSLSILSEYCAMKKAVTPEITVELAQP